MDTEIEWNDDWFALKTAWNAAAALMDFLAVSHFPTASILFRFIEFRKNFSLSLPLQLNAFLLFYDKQNDF